jgi:SAM-dependent methyltransferase
MDLIEYQLMDAADTTMWWYRALHARVAEALNGTVGRLLDAGCGTGGLLAALPMRMSALSRIGIEASAFGAARARQKSGAPVVCGSVNALPFAAASFDAAVATDVLCHADVDPAAALAELRRVLRPGGRLVVNMPAYAWLFSAHDRRVHNARRQNRKQVQDALANAGFVRIRAHYWNGLLLPMMIAQRKLFARGNDAASDVAPFPPWLDTILHAVTAIERRLPFPLPAGGSVLATAEAP